MESLKFSSLAILESDLGLDAEAFFPGEFFLEDLFLEEFFSEGFPLEGFVSEGFFPVQFFLLRHDSIVASSCISAHDSGLWKPTSLSDDVAGSYKKVQHHSVCIVKRSSLNCIFINILRILALCILLIYINRLTTTTVNSTYLG